MPLLSVAAVQESATDVLVMLLAVGVPGAVGGVSPGLPPPPSQVPPLTTQLDGLPEPVPLNPKLIEAPGASVPFHDLFLPVQVVPELVTSASQADVTAVPEGKVQ